MPWYGTIVVSGIIPQDHSFVLQRKENPLETALVISSIFLWLIVLANVFLTLALIRHSNAAPERGPAFETGPSLGMPAPDYIATTLDGERATLGDYIGRATTFVFVSPSCTPCHELLPSLKNLGPQARQAGAELVVVSNGTLEETREMARRLESQLPVLVAPRGENTFFHDYNIKGTPSFCSLDEQGIVVATGYPGQSTPSWLQLTTDWSRHLSLAERR